MQQGMAQHSIVQAFTNNNLHPPLSFLVLH